jgi:hypothetical protein
LSPSPDPPTYWLMEPSDPTTSPRRQRKPPCAIHGWSPCPYLVMLMHLRFSSLEQREGGEGNADDEEEDDEDSIEIFPILDSTSRPVPRHIVWIQVGAQWRPTGTLAPRYGAREPEGGGSPMTGSTVWRPPPPQDGVTTNSILREIKYFQTLTQRT